LTKKSESASNLIAIDKLRNLPPGEPILKSTGGNHLCCEAWCDITVLLCVNTTSLVINSDQPHQIYEYLQKLSGVFTVCEPRRRVLRIYFIVKQLVKVHFHCTMALVRKTEDRELLFSLSIPVYITIGFCRIGSLALWLEYSSA